MRTHAASLIAGGLLACTSSCAPTFMRDSEWNDRPPRAACEVIETTSDMQDQRRVVRYFYDSKGRLVFGVRESLDGDGGTGAERLTWRGLDLVSVEYLVERPKESCDMCKCYGAGCAFTPATRTIERHDLEWHGPRLYRVRRTRSEYYLDQDAWRLIGRRVDGFSIARSTPADRMPRIEWSQGRVSTVDYGNDRSSTFGYDELGRCVSESQVMTEHESVPDVVTQAFSRQHDQHGRLVFEGKTITHSRSASKVYGTEKRYDYDSVGRVVDVSTDILSDGAALGTTHTMTTYSEGCPSRLGGLTEAERAVNSVPARVGLMDCYGSPGEFYGACFKRD